LEHAHLPSNRYHARPCARARVAVSSLWISQLCRCTPQVIKKLGSDTDFISKETTRLKKMMDDGSVKAGKKDQFGRRLNALSSFKA
jgi:hypothetical protein